MDFSQYFINSKHPTFRFFVRISCSIKIPPPLKQLYHFQAQANYRSIFILIAWHIFFTVCIVIPDVIVYLFNSVIPDIVIVSHFLIHFISPQSSDFEDCTKQCLINNPSLDQVLCCKKKENSYLVEKNAQ